MKGWGGYDWVYVLRRFDPDTLVYLHKIGVSINPEHRARECEAELLIVEPGGYRREAELHAQFAHLHHRRDDLSGKTEWFLDEDGTIQDYIRDWYGA